MYDDASEETRKLAAKLRGFIEVLPYFHPLIPSKKKLYEASRELIGLSNGLYCDLGESNTQRIELVRRCLKIYGYDDKDVR